MKARLYVLPCLVLLAVSLVYSNHFANDFHLDDSHTILTNPAIRSLANIPRYFVDATTFSSFPRNQSYRPLVSASLALDYALAGGYEPFYFHLSTFFVYLVLIVATGCLFQSILGTEIQAWLGVAFFGLHPVAAETVNYIIQRADVYVALSLTGGMALYIRRRFGWATVAFALGCLAKPTALVFPLLALSYEYMLGSREYKRTLPLFAISTILAGVNWIMTPRTFAIGAAGQASPWHYRLTQPYIALTYLREALAPLHLAVDNEMRPFTHAFDPQAIIGYCGLLIILLLIAKVRGVIGYGLCWFLLAMTVTALVPLSDVTNDHRMFGPLVGLALIVGYLANTQAKQVAVAVMLVILAFGTYQRNKIWHDDVSLWTDTLKKRPGNGRAWFNLGATYLAHNQAEKALWAFHKAEKIDGINIFLELHIAKAYAQKGDHLNAEARFAHALTLDPGGTPRYEFGKYLEKQRKLAPAVALLAEADRRNPKDTRAKTLLQAVLRRSIVRAKQDSTCESYIDLSAVYFGLGNFVDARRAAEFACAKDPQNAYALGNLATCFLATGNVREAAQAAQRALSLKPDLEVAKRTLERAEELQRGQ